MTGQGRLHWAPYPSGLETGLLPHAEVRIWDSPDIAGEGLSQAGGTEDLGTHRSLWNDGPCLYWVTNCRGDVIWVSNTNVLVCICVDESLRRITVRRKTGKR